MDAMEDYHLTLLNILGMLEEFNQILLIHTLPRMDHVFTDLTLPLDTLDLEASILLKEIKNNLLKDYTMLDQFQSHSKLSLDSKTMFQEFIASTIVEKQLKMLIMLFWLLVMVLKMELNSGMLKIHGEQLGEIKDISKFKDKLTCVLLPNAMHIL